MTDHLRELSAQGVSIWLDDLSRRLITSGGLQSLIDTSSVVGVTTNPTIFAGALSAGDTYRDQIAGLAAEGRTVEEAVFALTTQDVRDACDIMEPVYRATGGEDGRVSIEVDPGSPTTPSGPSSRSRSWPPPSTAPTCTSRSRPRSRVCRRSRRSWRRASAST